MFQALSTKVLQHIIAQNSWANAILQPFAGQSVRFDFVVFSTSLVILENGSLAVAGETNVADASIRISPSLLMRLIAKDDAAKLLIEIEGDSSLATALAKVLTNMRWDYEDDFSALVGDIPANKVGDFARSTVHSMQETTVNLAEMLSEYWQEENPIIAKKRHVEAFLAQVDDLSGDVARLEKRIEKLASKIRQINSNNVDSVSQ